MLTSRLPLVTGSFLRQSLSHHQSNFLTSFTTHGNFRKTGKVLPHIQYESGKVDGSLGRFTGRGNLFRGQFRHFPDTITFHDFHRSRHLRTQRSLRSFLNHYRAPTRIIKTCPVPPFLFATRIIIFASINTIKGEGA